MQLCAFRKQLFSQQSHASSPRTLPLRHMDILRILHWLSLCMVRCTYFPMLLPIIVFNFWLTRVFCSVALVPTLFSLRSYHNFTPDSMNRPGFTPRDNFASYSGLPKPGSWLWIAPIRIHPLRYAILGFLVYQIRLFPVSSCCGCVVYEVKVPDGSGTSKVYRGKLWIYPYSGVLRTSSTSAPPCVQAADAQLLRKVPLGTLNPAAPLWNFPGILRLSNSWTASRLGCGFLVLRPKKSWMA
jgi:hypothetical protein